MNQASEDQIKGRVNRAPVIQGEAGNCCMTAMPREMRDADTIARLTRRVENLMVIAAMRDDLIDEGFSRSEDDAARLDLLQTSVSKTAFALDGWREILHVFAGDMEGFGRTLYNRQQMVLKGLEGLIVLIQPSADTGESTVASVAVQMLTLIQRAEKGELSELPTIPPRNPEGGYDYTALAEWSKYVAECEEQRLREAQAKGSGNRFPMPSVLAWCAECNRHVAPEDIVMKDSVMGEALDGIPTHRDCGEQIQYHSSNEPTPKNQE